MKTDIFQSLATVEFSKFAGILSAALSQQHLLVFEIAPLEFHFACSYYSWDSQGKNTEVVCHSLLQWTTFCQWPQDWKRSVFIPIPKKGNAKEGSNYRTVALISHTSKVMLKILQARLQQYVNRELPDVQAGFRKGR